MDDEPHWKLYSLIVAAGVFSVIFANIWRHSKKDRDTPGILLIQNFTIAIAGCAVLFWYWGYFEVSGLKIAPSTSPSEIACDDEMQQREVRAIALCLRSSDCDVTVEESLRVVTFNEVCAARADAERYKEGCSVFNPLTGREMKMSEEECWAFYKE